MQIGDKVRFLSEVGGGTVAGFQGRNIVLVEDEDGFQIPTPINEVVVVTTDNYNITHVRQTEKVEPTALDKPVVTEPLHKDEGYVRRYDDSQSKGMTPRRRRENVVVVDLHAHNLLVSTSGMSASDILKYQLETVHRTLAEHREHLGQRIVFIHGRGQGVLRQSILRELRSRYREYEYQDASFQEYGYGATMVTIHRPDYP